MKPVRVVKRAQDPLEKLGMNNNGIGSKGATALAAYVAVSASLTEVRAASAPLPVDDESDNEETFVQLLETTCTSDVF